MYWRMFLPSSPARVSCSRAAAPKLYANFELLEEKRGIDIDYCFRPARERGGKNGAARGSFPFGHEAKKKGILVGQKGK